MLSPQEIYTSGKVSPATMKEVIWNNKRGKLTILRLRLRDKQKRELRRRQGNRSEENRRGEETILLIPKKNKRSKLSGYKLRQASVREEQWKKCGRTEEELGRRDEEPAGEKGLPEERGGVKFLLFAAA